MATQNPRRRRQAVASNETMFTQEETQAETQAEAVQDPFEDEFEDETEATGMEPAVAEAPEAADDGFFGDEEDEEDNEAVEEETQELAVPEGAGALAVPEEPNAIRRSYDLGNGETMNFTLADVVRENLQGEKLTSQDLQRITVPAGEGQFWQWTDDDGAHAVQELVGVIMNVADRRAKWESAYGTPGASRMPECTSNDGITGSKYGDCATCEFAQFGSDPNPSLNGPACRQIKELFLKVPDSLLPVVVQIPRTSIGNFRQFRNRMTNRMTPFAAATVSLSLKTTETSGVQHAEVVFRKVDDLDGQELSDSYRYKEALIPALGTYEYQPTADPDDRFPNGSVVEHRGGGPQYGEEEEDYQGVPF